MANLELDGGIKIYLREIGKTALLTPDQEIELAARIKKGSKQRRTNRIQNLMKIKNNKQLKLLKINKVK